MEAAATAIRLVPALPVRFASFLYRKATVAVELIRDRPMTLAVCCPVCGKRSGLRQDDPRFTLKVNFSSGGVISVHPPITCATPACGWNVVVSEGVAFDVTEDRVLEEAVVTLAPGQRLCIECRRPFNPGVAASTKTAAKVSGLVAVEICRRCRSKEGQFKRGNRMSPKGRK